MLKIELLYCSAAIFPKLPATRPDWSGHMQSVIDSAHLPPSRITVLSVKDLDLPSYSCIYQGFQSRWMSVELICYVKRIIVFINFKASFVGGIL